MAKPFPLSETYAKPPDHFLIRFYEAIPNFVDVKYLNVSDHGGDATVGVQSGYVVLD
jgi:hypothetical protein